MINSITNSKAFESKYLMLFSIIATFSTGYYASKFLITEDVIYNFYAEQLSVKQIEKLLDTQSKWSWLGYVFIPIFYFIKIFLISGCVYAGLFFYRDNKMRFRDIMSMVVKADLIFLLPVFIKILWFSFGQTNFTFTDFQYFSPLSLLNIFDVSHVEKWLIYPLQAFNIFEVCFWVILGLQLKTLFNNDFNESFKVVLASYGSGFLVWVILVVFLTLNLS